MSIAVVLTCNINNENYSIILDTVNDTSITTRVDSVRHPLINGDVITDHIYRQPADITISGRFGMGKNQGIVVNNGQLKLMEIQSLFEKIKNEGILCSMVKVQINDQNLQEVRFLQRQNLLLKQIQWTESITTLDYTFSLDEIAFANAIEYDVDLDDNNLPNIQALTNKNFTDVLLNKEDLLGQIVKVLYENDLLSKSFAEQLKVWDKEDIKTFIITGGVAFVAISVLAICGIIAAGLSVTGPVGWVLGAAIVIAAAVISAVAVGIEKFVKWCKRTAKFKMKPFKKWNDKEKRRFVELLNDMNEKVNTLNDVFQFKGFTDNNDQEIIISLNDTYYVFIFKTNNSSGHKSLEIRDINDKLIGKGMSDITTAPISYAACNDTNCVLKDDDKKLYVSLVYTGEDNEEEKNKLMNYGLIISPYKPQEFAEILNQVLLSYLTR